MTLLDPIFLSVDTTAGTVQLDATFQSAESGGISVALIPASDSDPTVFRVCWNYRSSSFARLSCGRFDRATVAWRGMFVVDDNLRGNITTWSVN